MALVVLVVLEVQAAQVGQEVQVAQEVLVVVQQAVELEVLLVLVVDLNLENRLLFLQPPVLLNFSYHIHFFHTLVVSAVLLLLFHLVLNLQLLYQQQKLCLILNLLNFLIFFLFYRLYLYS